MKDDIIDELIKKNYYLVDAVGKAERLPLKF